MRNPILSASIVLLILAAGCASQSANNTQSSPPVSGNAVSIKGFAFNPAVLTIKAGTTVTWTNEDSASHDVISDTGAFASETLSNGETYSHKFDTDGTYEYHCGIHPSMKAKIIVEQ